MDIKFTGDIQWCHPACAMGLLPRLVAQCPPQTSGLDGWSTSGSRLWVEGRRGRGCHVASTSTALDITPCNYNS